MGINPTPTNHRSFTFDGKSTREFGVYITGEGVFNAPERAVEMISIPGRDGEYALDQGHFNNIEVTYRAGIVSYSTTDFAEAISNFRNWLASRKGYCRLTDEYNPDEYRMAVFKNVITVEHEGLETGEFDVVFNCKPQRWLTEGETTITIGEWGETETYSGEIASFEATDSDAVKALTADIEPIQDLNGYDAPWVGGAGKNKLPSYATVGTTTVNGITFNVSADGTITANGTATANAILNLGGSQGGNFSITGNEPYILSGCPSGGSASTYNIQGYYRKADGTGGIGSVTDTGNGATINIPSVPNATKMNTFILLIISGYTANNLVFKPMVRLASVSDATFSPYSNICPISGHDAVVVSVVGINVWDEEWELGGYSTANGQKDATTNRIRSKNYIPCLPNTTYYFNHGTNAGNVFEYDANKNFISVLSSPTAFTTSADAHYLTFYMGSSYGTTYNHDISINYPSTDHAYHSYSAESYHQDIEATYTPTVQENEAYLFKQTGDVGGDRETIELVGGTVAWNQLYKNITGYVVNSGDATPLTISVNDGYVNVSGTPTEKVTIDPTPAWFNIPANHVWLIVAQGSGNLGWQRAGGFQPFINGIGCQMTKHNADFSGHARITLSANNSYSGSIRFSGFDLTKMFGTTIADYIYSLETATAGAGVAFFRNLFPKAYYPYNADELISVKTTAHKTVGFNQWDEEWENGYYNRATGAKAGNSDTTYFRSKNYIPCMPSTSYYFVKPSQHASNNSWYAVLFYDANKNFISATNYVAINPTQTTPNNAHYMTFYVEVGTSGATYKNDICINISDANKNGTYEPYVENTYPLDADLELRGIPKLVDNKLQYDGDTYESDGSVTRKYGIVDLGSFTWSYNTTWGTVPVFSVSVQDNSFKVFDSNSKLMCAKYPQTVGSTTSNAGAVALMTDKQIQIKWDSRQIYISDSDYTDATAFKTAMSGVYLVYELATATTETAEAFEEIQKVTPIYGTEEFVDSRTVPIPVGNNTQYLTRDVYGGYIDLVSGLLTVNYGVLDLGDYGWNYDSTNNRFVSASAVSGIKVVDNDTAINGLCSMFLLCSANQTSSANYNGHLGVATNGRIVARNTAYTDGTAFKTSVTGQKLVYELATPQTYQLTPQQIALLLGENNIFADSGNVTVEVGQNPFVLINPTQFDSEPLLAVDGYGTIGFNGFEIEINNEVMGDVIVAEADDVYRPTARTITIQADRLNTSDTFVVNAEFRIQHTKTSSNQVTSITLGTATGCSAVYSRPNTVNVVMDSATFTKGTSATATCSIAYSAVTTNTGTVSCTQTCTVTYNGTDTLTFSTSGTNITNTKRTARHGVIYGDSTISVLGNPTYIDCEIGECYMIKNSEIISLNQYIDLGSDLPKLSSGMNTFAFDNTVTELKVTPRWWKV